MKKKTKKIYPQDPDPDPHEDFCPDPQEKNADPKPWLVLIKVLKAELVRLEKMVKLETSFIFNGCTKKVQTK